MMTSRRASFLYFLAGALALVAASVIVVTDGFLPDERFRAGVYILWAAVMFALGLRSGRRAA